MEERERYYSVQDVCRAVADRYEGTAYDPEAVLIRQATPLEYNVTLEFRDTDESTGFRILLDAPQDPGA